MIEVALSFSFTDFFSANALIFTLKFLKVNLKSTAGLSIPVLPIYSLFVGSKSVLL